MNYSCAVAVMLGSLILAGCATSSPEHEVPHRIDTDPMIVQLSTTARQARDEGELSQAIVLYRRGLDRARAMDNSQEIGNAAYNLAACLVELEDWGEAGKLLGEAEREMRRSGGDPATALLLAIEVARRSGKAGQAEAAIDRLEQGTLSSDVRGRAYVLRALLACDRGDTGRAEGYLGRAHSYLGKEPDPGLAAAMSEAAGRIAVLTEQWASAAKAYDREAAWRQRAVRLPEMALALEKAGQNHLKAGHADAAADRFYRSARSWMAQGNYLDALRVIEQAVQSQKEEDTDAEMAEAISRLFEEVRQSVETRSQAGVGSPP